MLPLLLVRLWFSSFQSVFCVAAYFVPYKRFSLLGSVWLNFLFSFCNRKAPEPQGSGVLNNFGKLNQSLLNCGARRAVFEAVLREFSSQFSLLFRAFPSHSLSSPYVATTKNCFLLSSNPVKCTVFSKKALRCFIYFTFTYIYVVG